MTAPTSQCRLRVGVIGCGLIAQIMHLPYLIDLKDDYEVAALCDGSQARLDHCGDRYGVAKRFVDWHDVLREPLDAVFVLSSGSHAQIAVAAAQAGLHVFVEKPMAMSLAEGHQMREAALAAGTVVMVGNMKRYDPAYERLQAELSERLADDPEQLRFVRVTTTEAPLGPTAAHHDVSVATDDIPKAAADAFAADEARSLELAVGDLDPEVQWCYRWILVDSLVHEINALRGLFGEVTEIYTVRLDRDCVSAGLRFGSLRVHLIWLDLPGIANYSQEFVLYAPNFRMALTFPSPYLKNAPSALTIEDGDPFGVELRCTRITPSYDEAFRRELVEFADAVTGRRQPRTTLEDGLADIAVCRAIVDSYIKGLPIAPRGGV